MLYKNWSGNTYLLLAGEQIQKGSMEMSVEVPQNARYRCAMWSCYNKSLYILLQRYFLTLIHCSIQNSQKIETL